MKYFLTCVLFLQITPCLASDVHHKLSEIVEKIRSVQTLLTRHQTQKTTLQHSLQKTELDINKLALELQKTAKLLDSKHQKLIELTKQQKIIEQKIQKQQSRLLEQIKLGYLLGLNKNSFQYLLQTNDPQRISRLLTYNRYLCTQNYAVMKDLKENLYFLKNNKNAIEIHTNHLAELKQKQIHEQKDLDVNKSSQEAVIKQLSLAVNSRKEELTVLLENKKNLENVIARLQNKDNYKAEYLTHHNGRFPWPTAGKIIEKFGSNIQHSELKQNGVLIQAPEGQKVYAVAPGKIIFADWMPGYGLLLIIDHGKGYMTLYGNNGVLYKKTHDVVGNHALIALVGHTGGQQKPALYFALRLNGKPINPATWCG